MDKIERIAEALRVLSLLDDKALGEQFVSESNKAYKTTQRVVIPNPGYFIVYRQNGTQVGMFGRSVLEAMLFNLQQINAGK